MEYLKKVAGRAVKRAARAGARKLLLLLLPYLAPFIPFLVFLFLIAVLVAATYSAMAPGSYLTGINPSPEDKEIQRKYEQLCNKYNIADTWLVNPGKPSRPRPGSPNYESSPDNPFYPNRGRGANIGAMVDRYRQDFKLRLTWGQVHGACLFRNYVTGEQEITDEQREKTAKDLHPYFYYKESEVIVCGKDGCESYTVYLLVEAYTIQGHYQYHYRWRTDTYNGGSVTYEEFAGMQQILPDRWERLKDWMKREYSLKDNAEEVELARTWLWEATHGFDEGREWLEWLLNNFSISSFASFAMVPPEYMPFLKEAEEKFGVPAWFLAALFQSESSWDPMVVNAKGCFGISQQHPDYWRERWIRLGFDPPELYQWDPRAQILAGAMVIADYLGDPKQIDWNGNLREDIRVVKAIAHYKGWANWSDLTLESLDGEVKRQVEIVLEYAQGMQIGATWPVPGYGAVSSHFGWRIHPVTGEKDFHEGIDIPAPEGTPIVSVSGGVVTYAGWNDGYGNCVTVRDGQHLYLYAHLSRTDVVKGQTVQPGQQIGAVGNTGSSTGPHLHFGVKHLTGSCWVDPLLVVQPQ